MITIANKDKTPEITSEKRKRADFWRWFLTNAVMNLVDVENMPPEMEAPFKMQLLTLGRVVFFNDKEKTLRCLWFKDAGHVPVYQGEIEKIRVVNPVLGDFTWNWDDESIATVYMSVLDRLQLGCGLSYLIESTVDDLSANDLTIRLMQFVKRFPTVFTAQTKQEFIQMSELLQKIANGDEAVVVQTPIDGSVKRLDAGQATTSPLSEFTEYQQYKLGQFYAMLGVNSVWNTKREHVAAAENESNGETARYNIADIVDNINEQLETVNKRFNTNFHVRLNVVKAMEIDNQIEDKPNREEETENDGDTNTKTDSAV